MGVVLAGGQGRRLGRDKAAVEFEGTTLAERAVTAVWPFCAGVLISIPADGPNPVPRFGVVRDEPPAGRGPLAGIDAAFRATGEADLLVLACDYPRVDSALLRRLVWYTSDEEDDLVMMCDPAGRDHPLVAVWKRATHAVVREALARNAFKVRGLLPDLRTRRVGPAEFPDLDLARALVNVNSPSDLDLLGTD